MESLIDNSHNMIKQNLITEITRQLNRSTFCKGVSCNDCKIYLNDLYCSCVESKVSSQQRKDYFRKKYLNGINKLRKLL